jgi:hypothetical protein
MYCETIGAPTTTTLDYLDKQYKAGFNSSKSNGELPEKQYLMKEDGNLRWKTKDGLTYYASVLPCHRLMQKAVMKKSLLHGSLLQPV